MIAFCIYLHFPHYLELRFYNFKHYFPHLWLKRTGTLRQQFVLLFFALMALSYSVITKSEWKLFYFCTCFCIVKLKSNNKVLLPADLHVNFNMLLKLPQKKFNRVRNSTVESESHYFFINIELVTVARLLSTPCTNLSTAMATRVNTEADTETPCTNPLILHTTLEKGHPAK